MIAGRYIIFSLLHFTCGHNLCRNYKILLYKAKRKKKRLGSLFINITLHRFDGCSKKLLTP